MAKYIINQPTVQYSRLYTNATLIKTVYIYYNAYVNFKTWQSFIDNTKDI